MSHYQNTKEDSESIAENVKKNNRDECEGEVGFLLPLLVFVPTENLILQELITGEKYTKEIPF